jgi:hypothetical protein
MRRIGFRLLIIVIWGAMAGTCHGELTFDWSNRVSAGFTAAEEGVFDAAFAHWASVLPTPEPRTMTLNITRIAIPDAFGQTFDIVYDMLGNPTSASIEIDSGTPFYVDPTPLAHDEFTPSGQIAHFHANPGGPADGKWDLFSVVAHEIGHALGFNDSIFGVGDEGSGEFYERYASRLSEGSISGTHVYHGEGFTTNLEDTYHIADDYDLMGDPGFGESQRALPSPLNIQILNDAYDYGNKLIQRVTSEPVEIPDATTTQVPISVFTDGTIADLDVAIYLEHTYTPDLDIFLVSPTGTQIQLSTDNGFFEDLDPACPCERVDFGILDSWTRFDDETITSQITATQSFDEVLPIYLPYAGNYTPEQSLSAFDGQSTMGTWTLRITDDEAGDSGRLLGAALIFALASLPGDFNGDGFVNAADYVVWRETLGQTGDDLPADGDGDGMIDTGDYDVWRTNFGRTAGAAAAASAMVPELGTLLSFVLGISAMLFWRRRLAL